MEDALRSVTTKRVSDARREEVRRELLNSEKLKVCPPATSVKVCADDIVPLCSKPPRSFFLTTRRTSSPSPYSTTLETRSKLPDAKDRRYPPSTSRWRCWRWSQYRIQGTRRTRWTR
jgi:hypothetical protein